VEMREEGADRQVFTARRWLARSLPPGEFEKRARIPIQAFLQTISVVPMGLVSVTLHDPGAEAPGYFHRVPTGHEIANLSGGAETPGVHSGGMRYNIGGVLHRSSAEVSRMFDRITFERNMMGDRACIRGMRIPVSVIVGQLAYGAPEKEILADYPDLEPEDIRQALEYAAWLAQEEVHVN
jgi:uncharacterized protein (DUF433 family)